MGRSVSQRGLACRTPVLAASLTAPECEVLPVPAHRGDNAARLHLSTRTLAWLDGHPHDRRLVRSVWDTLTELERAGNHPGAIDALRRVLTHHQPTSAGRCRTCRRFTWRRPPFPCVVWHQVRGELFGLFASPVVQRRRVQ